MFVSNDKLLPRRYCVPDVGIFTPLNTTSDHDRKIQAASNHVNPLAVPNAAAASHLKPLQPTSGVVFRVLWAGPGPKQRGVEGIIKANKNKQYTYDATKNECLEYIVNEIVFFQAFNIFLNQVMLLNCIQPNSRYIR